MAGENGGLRELQLDVVRVESSVKMLDQRCLEHSNARASQQQALSDIGNRLSVIATEIHDVQRRLGEGARTFQDHEERVRTLQIDGGKLSVKSGLSYGIITLIISGIVSTLIARLLK